MQKTTFHCDRCDREMAREDAGSIQIRVHYAPPKGSIAPDASLDDLVYRAWTRTIAALPDEFTVDLCYDCWLGNDAMAILKAAIKQALTDSESFS